MHQEIIASVPSLIETLLAALLVVLGLVAWLMKANLRSSERRIEDSSQKVQNVADRQEEIEKDLKDLRDNKADKEDLLRETGRVSMKLDALFTKLDQHEGSDNALRDLAIEMAKAVRREQ